MPRTPHKPAPTLPEPETVAAAHALTLAEERAAEDLESEMAFVAAKIAGRIEAGQFYEKISQKLMVESFLELKKNKAYRAITYRDADGNAKRVSDLSEFCERFLRMSARRMQQIVDNYHTIGSELFETAEQIGFRQKDYNAMKALPADDQAIIKQAMADDTDRDQLLDLLQELATRHASEKAALTAEAAEARETAEARDELVRGKTALVDKLHEENARLKRRVAAATPDEVGEQLRAEVSDAAFAAEAAIMGALRLGFEALAAHAAEHGVTHDNFMSGCLAQVEGALHALRADYQVKREPDSDVRPEWVRDGFDPDAAVEAAIGDDLKAFQERMKNQRMGATTN